MNLTLANFQLKAINDLLDGMEKPNREIVLKSCTGSGKTIILTHFIDEYLKSNSKTVFIWLSPGSGNLAEQSKEKMDRYIHGAQTKLLSDIMLSGFEENDVCFINWEKLTKKGNIALKDSERTNFKEHIRNAINNGLNFKIIIDESHHNDTIKAADIVELFNSDKIIRCSATPTLPKDAFRIDIPEQDVISEGLIKKLLIINEDFEQHINIDDQISYLLNKAIEKQQELSSEFKKRGKNINPLIVIQLPNNSDVLLDRVEEYLESKNITYENNQLAVWLADKKQNLEDIENNDAKPIAIIIKQAVATGWDCPRAHILVKLRDNMDETFEIQTIGRIRRMPEAHHYDSDLLDNSYLYTLDDKFTESVKANLGNQALDAYKIFLKPVHRNFSLISEYKTDVPYPRDAKKSLEVIYKYFEKNYNLSKDTDKNKNILETHGYIFSKDIIERTKSGSVQSLSKKEIDRLNDIKIIENLNTHKHGKEYHHCVSDIGRKVNLDYNSMNTIIRRLFLDSVTNKDKILNLDVRKLYAFIINNKSLIIEDVKNAMADVDLQIELKSSADKISNKPLGFPRETIFTYDKSEKIQIEYTRNVYTKYLSSAQFRSKPEKLFEAYCEESPNIDWFYKNGDKGIEYFSIIYTDNFGKQKSFYPDYVVGTKNNDIWIIETKGGFSRYGKSEDIDKFTPKKFEVLKQYTNKNNINGGIVREDKQTGKLFICTDNYVDDIKDKSWKLLSEIL